MIQSITDAPLQQAANQSGHTPLGQPSPHNPQHELRPNRRDIVAAQAASALPAYNLRRHLILAELPDDARVCRAIALPRGAGELVVDAHFTVRGEDVEVELVETEDTHHEIPIDSLSDEDAELIEECARTDLDLQTERAEWEEAERERGGLSLTGQGY